MSENLVPDMLMSPGRRYPAQVVRYPRNASWATRPCLISTKRRRSNFAWSPLATSPNIVQYHTKTKTHKLDKVSRRIKILSTVVLFWESNYGTYQEDRRNQEEVEHQAHSRMGWQQEQRWMQCGRQEQRQRQSQQGGQEQQASLLQVFG